MNKENKLLLAIDMQNDFIYDALENNMAKQIIPAVTRKIADWEKTGQPIIFTRDTHYDDYMTTEEGKNLPVPHCIVNTNGHNIIAELQGFASKHILIDKHTFGSNSLMNFLEMHPNQFDIIEIIGICTDICVISNAVIAKTASPNSHIIIDAACCAGVTAESHDIALNAMKSLQMEIINQGKEAWR